MTFDEVITYFEAHAKPRNREGMARYGIDVSNTYGLNTPDLRGLKRRIQRDHALALRLWEHGSRDARLLAAMIADPMQLSAAQADSWVAGLTSWDVCDGLCSELLARMPRASAKALEWAADDREFFKRAGFTVMARIAVSDRAAPDEAFEPFLAAVLAHGADSSNFVRKAVSWALHQIGKRDEHLRRRSLATPRSLLASGEREGRWAAMDAIRELEGEAVIRRSGAATARRARSSKG